MTIAMRQLNGVYTQRFNRAHERGGHVFQGRYKAILVEKESHLLEVARYVVLNPVRAKLAADAAAWAWSSYRATAGLERAPAFLGTARLLDHFGGWRARAGYRRFVAEGMGAESPWQGLAAPDVLGAAAFLERVQDLAGAVSDEVPKRSRHFARPPLAELRDGSCERAEWMARALRDHGYTLAAIAAEAGLHYSSVSKIVKRWENARNSKIKT